MPLLEGIEPLVAAGVVPGGTIRNLESAGRFTDFGSRSEVERIICADAQTSGGLLIAVDAPLAAALIQALEDEGVTGHLIGELRERTFAEGPGSFIRVR